MMRTVRMSKNGKVELVGVGLKLIRKSCARNGDSGREEEKRKKIQIKHG